MSRCNSASAVPVAASANGLLLPAAAEAARAAFLAKETPRVDNGADLSATNVHNERERLAACYQVRHYDPHPHPSRCFTMGCSAAL
jgi:hypothetical protein